MLAIALLVSLCSFPVASDPQAAALFLHDVDGDGLDDAVVLQPGASPRLLRATASGGFEDVSATAGMPTREDFHLALVRDVDQDARPDLLLASFSGSTVLLMQSEGGSFVDATARVGLDAIEGVVHAHFVELGGDARTDLHLVTLAGDRLLRQDASGLFVEIELGLEPRAALAERPATVEAARRALGLPRTWPTSGAAAATSGASSAPTLGRASGITTWCPVSVQDSSNPGTCLPASSVPTFGSLYPLGPEFFIEASSGNVGVGTTQPGARLDVTGGNVRTDGQLVSTWTGGPPLAVSSSNKVAGLNADQLDGLDSTAFSQFGVLVNSAEIADGAVTSNKILNGSVKSSDLLDGGVAAVDLAPDSVTTSKVADGSLALADVGPSGAAAGQVAQFDGSQWVPTTPSGGGIYTAGSGLDLIGSTFSVAPAGVDSGMIADGTLADADVSATAAIAGSKILANFGSQDVLAGGSSSFVGFTDRSAVRGNGVFGPTRGYLGVQGTTDFDGVASADWTGFEVGAAGISTGSSTTDNYGVLGHATLAGVRGEYAGNRTQDFGQLGGNGRGVDGSGTLEGVRGVYALDPLNWGALGTDDFGVRGAGISAGGLFGGSGSFDGVRGETAVSGGYGVFGRNASFVGSTSRGVMGSTNSSSSHAVYASGGFGGSGAKYFINPHPEDATKEVRFISLEGNESGTYFRGTGSFVGGRAEIEVPREFAWVTSREEPITVQVTPVGAPARAWIEIQTLDRIVVRSDLDCSFNYFVNGIRRGFEQHPLVYENGSYLPERAGEEYGTQYPDAYRRILVENGILNPDFTPNEAMMAVLENELEHYRVRQEDWRRREESERAHATDEQDAQR